MKKVFSIICLVILVSIMTACGKNMIGTYKLLEMESGGQKFSAKDLEALGIKMELVVKEKKKAVFSLDGEEQELTYNDKEFIGKNLETSEEEIIPYNLDGNKIILEKNGEKLVFEK